MTNGSGALCGLCAGCGVSAGLFLWLILLITAHSFETIIQSRVWKLPGYRAIVPYVESLSFCAPVPFKSHRRGCPMVLHAALNRCYDFTLSL